MRYEAVLEYFGGTQVKLAAALGITQGTVSSWKGIVPDDWQCRIEVMTNGALKAEDRLRMPPRFSAQPAAWSGRRRQMG